ncbi:MAG: transglycosylase SLT domain-containing protein [Candidatus Caenarcaniphilales bacterium]|nr:transglycosylase SLT domain-containing protein [Candidatus Caenarcaniphilales bacterium]
MKKKLDNIQMEYLMGLMKASDETAKASLIDSKAIRTDQDDDRSIDQESLNLSPDDIDDETVQLYMKSIGAGRLLTPEEEARLCHQVDDEDLKEAKRARQCLMQTHLGMVVSLAKRFETNELPLLDLIEQGNKGLKQAAKNYHESLGCSFSTYARKWINQYIKSALRDAGKCFKMAALACLMIASLGGMAQAATFKSPYGGGGNSNPGVSAKPQVVVSQPILSKAKEKITNKIKAVTDNLLDDVDLEVSGVESPKQYEAPLDTNANTDAWKKPSYVSDSDWREIQTGIKKASKKYGIPEKLIYSQINKESSFKSDAVSRSGAIGLMQIKPSTAQGECGIGASALRDPIKNIDCGVSYMDKLMDTFNKLDLALAAYNAGPGTVRRAVEKHGNSFNAIKPALTQENINYVNKILGAINYGNDRL